MTDQQEKLSALLDDYRDDDESRRLLNALQTDVNQQYTMQRYQMIGDVMRKELPDRIQLDLAARVRADLAVEPTLAVRQRETHSTPGAGIAWWSWLFKPAAGLAVAASVALVAITSMQSPGIKDPETGGSTVATAPAADDSGQKVERYIEIKPANSSRLVSGRTSPAASDGMTWQVKRAQPDTLNKLNTYLINHNEYANSVQGIIPQARIVGFDGSK